MSLVRWASVARSSFRLRPTSATIWGDGFEADSFPQMAAVRTWDKVSNDEFLRLYPRLVDGGRPRLLAHIELCVATLCMQAGTSSPHHSWFAEASQIHLHRKTWSPSPTRAYLRAIADGEADILNSTLANLKTGDMPTYEPKLAELFGFHTAVHPAYFWAEAVAIHQRLTTFAWIGVVTRGRPALMPYDVAEYLLEYALHQESDPELTSRLGTPRMATRYLRQAKRRIEGREVIASLPACKSRQAHLAWGPR